MLNRTHLALLSAVATLFVVTASAMALNPQPLPPRVAPAYGKLSGPTGTCGQGSAFCRKAGGEQRLHRAR